MTTVCADCENYEDCKFADEPLGENLRKCKKKRKDIYKYGSVGRYVKNHHQ